MRVHFDQKTFPRSAPTKLERERERERERVDVCKFRKRKLNAVKTEPKCAPKGVPQSRKHTHLKTYFSYNTHDNILLIKIWARTF